MRGGPSGPTQAEKRKFEDSKLIVAAKSVKKQYTAKEKADYEKKKAGERRVKKEGWVALVVEFKNRVGAEAHKGVDQKVVDKGKSDNECMQCGMQNDAWTYCQKPVQVLAVHQGQGKAKPQSVFTLKRHSQVATVAADGPGESIQRAVQRPPGWAFKDDDIL